MEVSAPDPLTSGPALLPDELRRALERLNLVETGTHVGAEPLLGGVSSDIWRVDCPTGSIVVKRALLELRVAQHWAAPAERSSHEAAWLRMAARAVPGVAPTLLGFDESSGTVAMTYLDPRDHPCWKQQLLRGVVSLDAAAEVGRRVGLLHAATADEATWRSAFDDPAMFASIRLDPYFDAVALRHPDRSDRIAHVRDVIERHAAVVIHGDVSPKNVHIGPQGPVLLDAECATWGDPAFDLAFCLTHLLLKALVVPASAESLRRATIELSSAYRAQVTWEEPDAVERRAAQILAVLLLARVDGKSPVDYLSPEQEARVRDHARALLLVTDNSVGDVTDGWIGFR